VRLAGGVGESAWHQKQVSASLGITSVEFRKAQVITHAQPDAPAVAVTRGQLKHGRVFSSQQGARLIKLFQAIVKTEQMYLVVARNALTLRGEHQGAIENPVVALTRRTQRQGAADHPQPILSCRFRQALLYLAAAH
jgi:hypothetical protein